MLKVHLQVTESTQLSFAYYTPSDILDYNVRGNNLLWWWWWCKAYLDRMLFLGYILFCFLCYNQRKIYAWMSIQRIDITSHHNRVFILLKLEPYQDRISNGCWPKRNHSGGKSCHAFPPSLLYCTTWPGNSVFTLRYPCSTLKNITLYQSIIYQRFKMQIYGLFIKSSLVCF